MASGGVEKKESVEAGSDVHKLSEKSPQITRKEGSKPMESPPVHSSASDSTNSPSPAEQEKVVSPFEAEVAAITEAFNSASSKAIRAAIRGNWRKCLIGSKTDDSKSDEAYFVRAILKHRSKDPNDDVMKRVMEEYGDYLIGQTRDSVLQKLMERHGERLLAVASPEVLDRAIELRLPSVNAQQLVNMLSNAKRLGYEERDFVDAKHEEVGVMPSGTINEDSNSDGVEIEAPRPIQHPRIAVQPGARLEPPMYYPRDNYLPAGPPVVLPSQTAPQVTLATRTKPPITCLDCGAVFSQSGGLKYHTMNEVCKKAKAKPVSEKKDKFFCKRCNKGFTNVAGVTYHTEKNVCRNHETAKATPPAGQHRQDQNVYAPPQQPSPSGTPQPSFYPQDGLPNVYPNASDHPKGQHINQQPSQLPPNAPQYHHTYNRSQYPVHHPPYSGAYQPHYQPPPPQQAQLPAQQGLSQRPLQDYPEFRVTTGNPATAMHTPIRQHPSAAQMPVSSPILDGPKVAEMTAKLVKESDRYEKKLAEIPENLTAVDRDEEIQKIKRGHATRKSMIRKEYGIQIRRSKLRPANTIATPEGEVDLSSISGISGTPGSAPSFASVNRLEAFRAPAPSSTPSLPRNQIPKTRPGPPLESTDAKRRRHEEDEPGDTPSPNTVRDSVEYAARLENMERRTVSREVDSPKDASSHASPATTTNTVNRSPSIAGHRVPSDVDMDLAVAAHAAAIVERNESHGKSQEAAIDQARLSSADPSSNVNSVIKKIPLGGAQKKWEALRLPRQNMNVSGIPGSPISSESSRSLHSPKSHGTIIIPSDSDVESDNDEDIPARRPSEPRTTQSRGTSENPALNIKYLPSRTQRKHRQRSIKQTSPIMKKTTRSTSKA